MTVLSPLWTVCPVALDKDTCYAAGCLGNPLNAGTLQHTGTSSLASTLQSPAPETTGVKGHVRGKKQKQNKHTEISCPFTHHNDAYIGIWSYFIVKYNYKYYNWNIVIVVRFPVKTMSCHISWDASCAHLEVRKHNFVAKIVKTPKTDTAKCITIHHTNVKHSLWGKNCFSNLEIMK